MAPIEPRDRSAILIHFYRAMVGRADMWRMRMDTTANWAIGATAAVISFAIGNASVPHYAVFMAPLLTLCFLMLEARRLTFYHLWQQRVLLMERGLVRPALWAGEDDAPAMESDEDFVRALDPQLGATVPTMPLIKAAARRLRRIYVYLFVAQEVAWIVKLASHPTQATSLSEIVSRAGTAGVPGLFWFLLSLVALAAAVVVATTMGGVDRRA